MADSCDNPLGRRKVPCSECPWRKDTPPGQFPAHRYDQLRRTSGSAGREAGLDAPMFACHKSAEGKEIACAGWLAAVGYQHLGIRRAVIQGRLPADALRPADDWPELFADYDQMADTQGRTQP